MYRVSENGHSVFWSIPLFTAYYDFGMDLVYIRYIVRK